METISGASDRREILVLSALTALSIVLIAAVCILQYAHTPVRPEVKPVRIGTTLSDLLRSDRQALGDENGRYVLVEFGDYQCPACVSAPAAVKSILEAHKGSLRFSFRHLPLPMHLNAVPAARAAEAAAAQGVFWQMHEGLLALHGDIREYRVVQLARSLKLDMTRFDRDRAGAAAQRVTQDLDFAQRFSIRATPTFVLACPSGSVYKLPDLDWVERAIKDLK